MSPGPDHDPRNAGAGFAATLRARRLARGLTQEELASRAGLGVRTLRELERGRVARPQRNTVSLLAEALLLTGLERDDFLASAARPEPAAVRPPVQRARPASKLPASTLPLPTHPPLTGRDADVEELLTLLGGPYGAELVALVGLAGVGKTSLAHAVAQRVAATGATAVSVTVTDISQPNDIFAAVAAVFGVARAEELVERYASRPALLVLDGVDRSPRAAVDALQWLRSRVPSVRILATSRRPLAGALPGVVDWRVEPLDLPPPGLSPPALRRAPAVALFLDRLRQVRREPVADAELGAVAELVRRLDGLPLAIELAAARGRVLELPELLSRYGNRVLDLAATEPAGQRLRDAVAASYHLLDEREQAALRRLSVFRGRWSLELAEALLDDGYRDVEAILDRLVGLGLVSVRGPGDLRFRLLDVVMDFAAEQSANSGELRAARLRHAEVVTRIAVRVSADLVGPASAAAVSRLDYLNSDIRTALRYTSVREPAIALRLAGAIPRWCRLRGRDVEAHHLLRRLLDDKRTQDCDPLVRAIAQVGAAMLATAHGRGVAELWQTEAALEVVVAHGDTTTELTARALLAGIWHALGGTDDARRHCEAMLGLAIRTGRVREIAVAQNNLAWHDIRAGDLATAARRLTAAGRRAVEAGDARVRALTQANLAEVARLDGRFEEAVELGRRAAATIAEIGDPPHRVRALGTLGLALAEAGRPADAAAVLVELTEVPGNAGMTELITAYLAMGRGDRAAAARSFESAANLLAGRDDVRDVLEALVGLAACAEPAVRDRALEDLAGLRANGGLGLLPREHRLLGR
ncbi:helix-turn-helix domain-containing protein [Dactylosporangium sucinum]|uniref:XRE family transcriptional regulator n=1 Tax=Dactylosporangium sucinum TaxID=1424081 RepID=A0A917X165_9ACTN|nr:helix-turn-helix domain-containing protein [Dactylosporangium sucinum]GGM50683.1 XRE family transcriptional regulator [Dactylosporangium sucinum]